MLRCAALLGLWFVVGCSADNVAVPVSVAPATSLPADIRRGLNTDPAVLACADASPGQPIQVLDDWFQIYPIARRGERPGGLLVEATAPCLRGVGEPFWLYAATGSGYRLDRALRNDPVQGQAWRSQAERGLYPVVDDAPNSEQSSSLPETLLGRWLPRSAVYYALEPLVLGRNQMRVGRCADVAFSTLARTADSVLIELATDHPCAALEADVRVMRLTLGGSNCELEMTTYASAAKAQSEALLTWGLFDRPDCP